MEFVDPNIYNLNLLLRIANYRGWLKRCPTCGQRTYVKQISIVTQEDSWVCFNPSCSTFSPLRYADAKPCGICGIPSYLCYC